MKAELLRIAEDQNGVHGVLSLGDEPICITLELPWRFNTKWNGDLLKGSCIPCGNYTCVEVNHKKYGRTFLVEDVPNRDGIYFHTANKIKELKGCIAPGSSWGFLGGEFAILNSARAMDLIRQKTAGVKYLELEIVGANGRCGHYLN